MSSILKALKKLEDEYPRRTGGKASWPRTPGVKKTLRRWEINSGRFAPVLWGALTVVVLTAAAWFLIYMRSPGESPGPSAQLPSPPLQSAVEKQQPTDAVRKPPPTVRRPTGQDIAGARRRRVLAGGNKTRTAAAVPVRTKKGDQQRGAALSPPANPAETQTGADVPVLESGLELQAVSWSTSPANRIAVINGSIVREGGSIGGFSVTRIEQDEVLVRKGLSQWKLVFNLKK